ncbi:MAG: cryptochrome/photolyase family protein [Natrialbaceae archaeon]|nr:cryptochrome/photolyase family protein [Natrialbaceae archaeon]
MRPATHGSETRLESLVADHGGSLEVLDNNRFLCSIDQFEAWADTDQRRFRHESFYRFMRRETGYLMDEGEPMGGEWNYDDRNQQAPPAEYAPPDPPRFEPDALTRAVEDWVTDTFEGSYHEPPYGTEWADPEPFRWPVTRSQSRTALESFITDRLPTFGPYQDAMLAEEFAMNHSLLSPALNLGLLHPRDVIERALDAFEAGDAPLPSVEGFLRQVLGWREFVRHVYRRRMPELASANALEADRDLPELYWHGETDMACLADVIEGVRARGYSRPHRAADDSLELRAPLRCRAGPARPVVPGSLCRCVRLGDHPKCRRDGGLRLRRALDETVRGFGELHRPDERLL